MMDKRDRLQSAKQFENLIMFSIYILVQNCDIMLRHFAYWVKYFKDTLNIWLSRDSDIEREESMIQ